VRKAVMTVDLPLAIKHLEYFAGWSGKIEGNTIPVSVPDTMVRTEREPVGVVAQIVPWNYPLQCAHRLRRGGGRGTRGSSRG
jgi:acyl-CoA reductase-like NAD-dependent aldehyde dehydrogenase